MDGVEVGIECVCDGREAGGQSGVMGRGQVVPVMASAPPPPCNPPSPSATNEPV